MTATLRRTARFAFTGALALAIAGCGGGEDAEKAAADAAANRQAQYQEQLLAAGLAHDVQCLGAIRWQEAALREADVGDLDIYRSYFRSGIENRLGETVIAADPPQPELSQANLDAYLDWAYADQVENVFRAGGDGGSSAGRGFQIVASCIQEVAEMGEGPLAGPDKNARMFRIEALRNSLEDKGA
ncbi:hypothetical protein [Sphingosinithalassobacter sp. LHW66-3]|uniref:hypothetical protein n=1 Tax=Sphingosinithalassobacter sp. LHW66-3 TaxID=3424718 RepID=UPI003D6B675A